MATGDGRGDFRISRSGHTPPADCTVDVNDGSATPANARLSGCTVTSTLPPPRRRRPRRSCRTSQRFRPATSAAAVTTSTTVMISATYGGVTRTATLTINPAPATNPDTVTLSRAEYDSGKRTLRVDAASNRTGATLRAYVTSSGALIGTLSGAAGSFSLASNPQSITIEGSLGGSATRTVTAK